MKKKILVPMLLFVLFLGGGAFIWHTSPIVEKQQEQPKKEQEVTKSNPQVTIQKENEKPAPTVPNVQEQPNNTVENNSVANQVVNTPRIVGNVFNQSILPQSNNLQNTAKTVENSSSNLTVQEEMKKDPRLVKVSLNKQEGIELTEDQIKVEVLTEDIENKTEVIAEFTKEDGTSFEPKIEVKGQLNNQTLSLDLNLNDEVAEGNYVVKVSVNGTSFEEKLIYKLNHKIVPTLKLIDLDKNHHIEKSTSEVEVTLNTVDIENSENIILELLNSNNEVQIKKEVQVQDNVAKTKLILVDMLPFGKYVIRATYKELQLEKEYEILYLPVPEILEAKLNKKVVSYGYNENLELALKLKDIEVNSDMKITLLNEEKQPVEGYTVQNGKTEKDAFNYTLALSPLKPGRYFIRVEYNESVFKDIELSVSDAKNNWQELLDYSRKNDELYWFDELNRAYAYKDINSPFDPKKPTIIFIHGWQNGSVKKNYAPDFNYTIEYDVKEGDKTVKKQVQFNSVKAWTDAGYNVGVYNWVQIADEEGDGWFSIPYSAEAKIWTPNYQYYKIPMRYRLNNGTFINEPNKTAADLFVEKYLDAMKDYQGDHITLAGHSLGNQMVLRSTSLILEHVENNQADKAIVPDRLTLLDPYYSGNSDKFATYKGQTKTNSQAAALMAKEFASKNIVIEMFKSSLLTTNGFTGDVNKELENIAAYSRINPDLLGITEQHSAGHQFYFWAKHTNNPLYISNDSEVASLMGSNFRVGQNAGKTTVDPSDDTGKIEVSGKYVPVEDIILKDDSNNILTQTDKENAAVLKVKQGEYVRVNTSVAPANASSKVVVIEEVEGDKDAVQIAYDGYIKGVKQGSTLLRAIVTKRDVKGNIIGTIEKYFNIVVE